MKGKTQESCFCSICGFEMPDGNYAPSMAKKGVFKDGTGKEWRIQVSEMLSHEENDGRKAGFHLLPICDGCLNEILDFIKQKRK